MWRRGWLQHLVTYYRAEEHYSVEIDLMQDDVARARSIFPAVEWHVCRT